jgi:hypothetical protein
MLRPGEEEEVRKEEGKDEKPEYVIEFGSEIFGYAQFIFA